MLNIIAASFIACLTGSDGEAPIMEEIRATPVLEKPADPPVEPGPAKDPLDILRRIEEQNRHLNEKIDRLNTELEEANKKTMRPDIGTGMSLALRRGDLGRPIFEADLSYLFAYLYAKRGGGFGVMPTVELWRLRLHPLGTGLLWYFDKDKPMTVDYIPRGWDILFTSAVDAFVWRKLQVRFQVIWIFPNPSAVGRYATKRAKEDWRQFRRDMRGRSDEGERVSSEDDARDTGDGARSDFDRFSDEIEDDSGIFGDAYKRAGRRPFYVIGVRWVF